MRLDMCSRSLAPRLLIGLSGSWPRCAARSGFPDDEVLCVVVHTNIIGTIIVVVMFINSSIVALCLIECFYRLILVLSASQAEGLVKGLPRGSIVVPFCGSYLESYKLIPKRNYYGAYG